jgi:hypothetical protein
MAIFPPDAPNYTDPVFDNVMNYGSGTLLIPVFFLALFLNALVFHVKYTEQKLSIVTALFLVLATSDFLYTLVKVPYIIFNLLNPDIAAEVKSGKPTIVQNIVAGVGCLAAYVSICAIFGISIMRFIKLGYPVWATSHKTATRVIALVPMVITILYSAVLEIAMLSKAFDAYIWSNTAQDILLGYNMLLFIRIWTVLAPTALSFLLGIATIAKIYRDQQLSSHVRYSMVTILFLSAGNVSWTIQWSVTAALGEKYFFNKTTDSIKGPAFMVFFSYVIMPSLIALYNPLVLCVRTAKMRSAWVKIATKFGLQSRRNAYVQLE